MKKLLILFFLLFTINANAQELITSYDENTLPVLNEVLRVENESRRIAEARITVVESEIIPLSRGGTETALTDPGQDSSVYWDYSEGAMAFEPGTIATIPTYVQTSGLTFPFIAGDLVAATDSGSVGTGSFPFTEICKVQVLTAGTYRVDFSYIRSGGGSGGYWRLKLNGDIISGTFENTLRSNTSTLWYSATAGITDLTLAANDILTVEADPNPSDTTLSSTLNLSVDDTYALGDEDPSALFVEG